MKNRKLIIVEEIFNSITHGLGAIASIAAIIFLILMAREGSALKLTSFIVFGISLFTMYLFSTLFHSLSFTKAKKLFFIFDRAAIFLLIAGTTTPIILSVANNLTGWLLLGLIWALGVAGITLNAVFPDKYPFVYVPVYLLMGWIGVSMIGPLAHTASLGAVWLLLLGGGFYTLGTIFHGWNKLPFNHTIWHLFVIGGTICHFMIMHRLYS